MTGWVPLTVAAAAVHRPPQTLHTWIRRTLVASLRDHETRELLVWWPHVLAQSEEAEYRAPRPRRMARDVLEAQREAS